jgi:hypothetical protein
MKGRQADKRRQATSRDEIAEHGCRRDPEMALAPAGKCFGGRRYVISIFQAQLCAITDASYRDGDGVFVGSRVPEKNNDKRAAIFFTAPDLF